MFKNKNLLRVLLVIVIITLSIININTTNVFSATNQFKGVNWADTRDNFQSGVLYLSGLSSSDTYSSAAATADRIISQLMSLLGSNSVRMPINEATVSSFWSVYTGAIDKALSKGKVILCYWAASSGKPANMTNFWNMWTTVVNKYGSNSNCYFEPINEPYGYSNTDLCNVYNDWLTKFSSVPDGRVVLDGAGYAQNVPAVGADSRLSGCLLAVHDYSFFVSNPYRTESEWANHLAGYVGSYTSRTICTEWGYPNSPGTKNGVSYDYIDYNASSSTTFFYYYCRGLANQLRSWNMGSFYWPGFRDTDWYSMTKISSGSGSTITLSIPNYSGFGRLKYAWGDSVVGTPTPTSRQTPTPSATVNATPTPTRSVTPTPTSPNPGPGVYLVTYSITNDWGSGATINITIKNTFTVAVNGWTLAWTFPGNQTITTLWNGTYTQSGASVSVKDNGNANIAANGGTVTFGFNINYSNTNAKPTSFTLNGTACQIQ